MCVIVFMNKQVSGIMKNKFWLLSILLLFALCSYLFYYFYKSELNRKITEVCNYQKIQAKLAAKGFNELFEKWNNELFYLSKDEEIISVTNAGRSQLTTLQTVLADDIANITRVDKSGKIIFTVPYYPGAIGKDISKQKHIAKIISDHKPVVSDVFKSAQGYQTVAIHYPVFKNGKFEGTIGFSINFFITSRKILDEMKFGNAGYARMLSSEGIELYSSVGGYPGKSIYETTENSADLPEISKKMMAGEEGIVRYTTDSPGGKTNSVKKIAYLMPIWIDNTFWSIAIISSEDEITESLSVFMRNLIIVFCFVFTGGMLISYFGVKALFILKESESKRRAEEELQKSEERYRFISTTVSDYMFTSRVDKDGNLYHDWIGGAFESITGYSYDEYVAQGGWRGTLHPEDIPQDELDMAKLEKNEDTITEIRTLTKTGKTVWVRVYAHPIWDNSQNKLSGIYGAVQNINEKKRYEILQKAVYEISQASDEAATSQDLYRSVHDIVKTVMPAENFYIALHDTASNLIRFPYFVDENDPHPQSRTPGKGLTEYVLKKGDPLYYNNETNKELTATGAVELIGTMPLLWLGVPLKIENKIIGVMAVQQYSGDPSYGEMELQMLKYVSSQVARVIKRKNDEDELRKAKEKAEEMNRLKSNFLTNMSHELRTPLMGMLGFSELLSERLEGEEKEIAEMLNLSSKRLLRTLNAILNYSEIESDQLRVILRKTDLGELIGEQIKLFKIYAQQYGLSIRQIDGYPEKIFYTDERIVEEIVSNLLHNALKYTRKGGVTVSSRKMKDHVEIKVEDSGIGIPADKLEVIFEEFRQVSEGIGRNFEGTGLGLAIVKKYVHALGGSISVESKLDVGSAFTVSLPITEVKIESGLDSNPDIPATSGTPSELLNNEQKVNKENYKILLVEDDAINSMAIVAMLNRKYSVEAVNNASDAIARSRAIVFDLILMDINLGKGENGIEAVKEIRKNIRYENIPIVAMTAYAMKDDETEFLRSGFTHYISKPFGGKEITSMLETIMNNLKP